MWPADTIFSHSMLSVLNLEYMVETICYWNLVSHSHLEMWEWFWIGFQILIAKVIVLRLTSHWRCRNMSSKVKLLSWGISRYVVNWIPSSLETRCDWCKSAFHYFSAVLAWRNVSWHASFTKKHFSKPKLHRNNERHLCTNHILSPMMKESN